MPKKIKFESIRYHLLINACEIQKGINDKRKADDAEKFIESLSFEYTDKNILGIGWSYPEKGELTVPFATVKLYTKYDDVKNFESGDKDEVYNENRLLFKEFVKELFIKAGIDMDHD